MKENKTKLIKKEVVEMKMFYSALEYRTLQMDREFDLRKAELDKRVELHRKDVELQSIEVRDEHAFNEMKLTLETKNAQDKAQSIIDNAKVVAELTEKLAVARAGILEKSEHISNLQYALKQEREEKVALLATVTELAKKPVIVEKTTQTATALPGQTFIVMDGKTQPIVKV
jgi:hypothetical protein